MVRKPVSWTAIGVGVLGLVLSMCGMASAGGRTPWEPGGTAACRVTPAGPSALGARVSVARGAAAVRLAGAGGAQVSRNDRADVTFEVRPGANGALEIRASRGDLQVQKTVQSSGEFVLTISRGRDTVSVAVSSAGARVTSGKTTIVLDQSRQDERQAAQVRRLLAESAAVLHFRAAAEALLVADDRSAPAIAFLLADAAVGALSGDIGAPRRVAQHLVARARRDVRPVGLAIDCFTTMEQRMVEAWTDYQSCWISTMSSPYFQEMCSWRWILQVESYWFSFIGCSGFNW